MLTPIDANGDLNTGANAVKDALQGLTYPGCIGATATTAPGSQTNQVKWGINSRFGTGNGVNKSNAADLIIDYPRDTLFQGVVGGRGGSDPSIDLDPAWTPETHWDPESFWYDMYQQHDAFGFKMYDGFGNPIMLNDSFGAPMEDYNTVRQDIIDIHPNNPNNIVTRYGMYLQQLTDEGHYVIEDNIAMTTNPDCSGQAGCVGIDRRKIKIAVVHCGDGTPPTQNVSGATEIDVHGQYLDIFLTALVDDPNVDTTVYAEIVGDSSGDSNGSQDEISNVRLVN
jgi:hypothetical protein